MAWQVSRRRFRLFQIFVGRWGNLIITLDVILFRYSMLEISAMELAKAARDFPCSFLRKLSSR